MKPPAPRRSFEPLETRRLLAAPADPILLAVSGSAGGPDTFALADRGLDEVSAGDARLPGELPGASGGLVAPGALALADLDGDGIPDLVVADAGADDLRVSLGLGGGRFGPPRSFPVGTDPDGITVADLDGDGIPDLVVADRGSDDLTILLGEGRGPGWTLRPAARPAAGAGPVATAVVALGPGPPSILVSDGSGDEVRLLRGLGGGSFDDSDPTVFATGSGPGPLFVADFSGVPGELDLVVVDAGSKDLSYFRAINRKAGVPAVRIPSGGPEPVAAVVGNFGGPRPEILVADEGDGRLDLFAVGVGVGGLVAGPTFQVAGLAHPTSLAVDPAGHVFGASGGVASAVPIILGLGSALGTGPAAPPPPAGPGGTPAAILQPSGQSSLAIVATLLSVAVEMTGDQGVPAAASGAGHLPNQPTEEGEAPVGTDRAGESEGGAGAGEPGPSGRSAPVERFLGGLDAALAGARDRALGGSLLGEPPWSSPVAATGVGPSVPAPDLARLDAAIREIARARPRGRWPALEAAIAALGLALIGPIAVDGDRGRPSGPAIR